MDRKEHLQWCKDRALEYVEKHEGTANTSYQALIFLGMMDAQQGNREGVRRWVEGFN